MAIESTASNLSNASANVTTAVQPAKQTQESSKSTKGDTSFKEELNKNLSTESKEKASEKSTSKNDEKVNAEIKDDANFSSSSDSIQNELLSKKTGNDASQVNNPDIMNAELANNIQLMMSAYSDTNSDLAKIGAANENINVNDGIKAAGIFSASVSYNSDGKTQLSLSEKDAEFFINVVNDNKTVSTTAIVQQAQNEINSGADVKQIEKSSNISQALLDAINKARETNQPLRIDFDNNVAVILRISKDGTIGANFIPSDKAVEQYLRNNIGTLKNTFDENNLPYSDLSYSNSSKEQNRRRREEKRQGE